jgi:hypothetical protein
MTNQNNRKISKHNNQNVKKTLDVQHSHKLSQMQDFEAKQNESKDNIKEINKKLEHLNQIRKTSGLSDKQFEEYIALTDDRDDLVKELDKAMEQMDEVDYYVNVGSTLFKYYDIIEKGASDDENINKIDVCENSILKFFIKQPDVIEEDEKKDLKDDRASLLERYLVATDDNYIVNQPYEIKDSCKYCSSSNISMLLNDGINYCNDCNSIEYVTVEHDRPSYHQPNFEVTYFAYKRINHLNELKYIPILWIFIVYAKKVL